MVEAVKKDPRIAAIASFFVPGLGQVYEGEGLLVGIVWLIGALVCLLFCILPGLAVWLYGIYNAYTVAEKMNAGVLPFKPTSQRNMVILIIIALVLYVIYVTVIVAAIMAAFVFGMYGAVR